MTDLLSEPRISPNALAHREGVHPSTVWRWCLRGCNGHILESFNVGGKRYTTQPAFERWIANVNGPKAPTSQTPGQRESAIEAAERELDKLLRRKKKRKDADAGNERPTDRPPHPDEPGDKPDQEVK